MSECCNTKAAGCWWNNTDQSSLLHKSTPDFFTSPQEPFLFWSSSFQYQQCLLSKATVNLGEFSSPSTTFFLPHFLLFLHVKGAGQKTRLLFDNYFLYLLFLSCRICKLYEYKMIIWKVKENAGKTWRFMWRKMQNQLVWGLYCYFNNMYSLYQNIIIYHHSISAIFMQLPWIICWSGIFYGNFWESLF